MKWNYTRSRVSEWERDGYHGRIKYPEDARGILYILHLNDDIGWTYTA